MSPGIKASVSMSVRASSMRARGPAAFRLASGSRAERGIRQDEILHPTSSGGSTHSGFSGSGFSFSGSVSYQQPCTWRDRCAARARTACAGSDPRHLRDAHLGGVLVIFEAEITDGEPPAMVPSMRAYLTCGAKRCVTVAATQRAPGVVNSTQDTKRSTSTQQCEQRRRHPTQHLRLRLTSPAPAARARARISSRQLGLHRHAKSTRIGPSGERQRTPTPVPTFRLKCR